MPMDIGEMIPADDSVRLLNAVMERKPPYGVPFVGIPNLEFPIL